MDTSTQDPATRLHEPEKLTPAEVAEVSENIPELVDWLDASAVPQSQEAKAEYNQRLVDVCEQLQQAFDASTINVDREDRLNWSSYLAAVGFNFEIEQAMEPLAAALWEAGSRLDLSDSSTHEYRVGHLLLLSALCASPDAVMAMLYWLRAELLRVDPELARLSAGAPDPGLRARIKRDVLIEANLEAMARIAARKQARLPKVVRRRLRA